MSLSVHYDHEKFQLMEDNDFSLRIPYLIEKSEFEKFQKLIRIYSESEKIPPKEVIEIYSMKKNDDNVWEVLENSKHIVQANKYKAAGLWLN